MRVGSSGSHWEEDVSGRRLLIALLVLATAFVAVAPAVAGDRPGGSGPAVEPPTDQIVIRLAPGKTLDTASLDATAGIDLRQLRRLGDGSYVLKLPKRHGRDSVRAITDSLAARGDVVSAEPDALMEPFAIPNDTRWSEQWDMLDPSSGSYGISAPGAWDLTTGSPLVTVGVIDTGYRPHADLTGRFVPGYDFISDAQIANDGDGRDADSSDPGDWVTSAESSSGYFVGCGVSNSSWHGTHVSGTIGANGNNGVGVAGINWGSKIQMLRVLGKCGGYTSDIADAIRWAAGLPVAGVPANPTPDRVVNISLGGSGACSSTYQSAIDAAVAAGTVVVVAAGNSNGNASGFQPANCGNVITVAATGHTGNRAYYSNYGTSVEIAAPGGDAQLGKTILSTLNAGTTVPGADSYATYQGTSMATPHVVGVVSLMLSVNPGLTPAQVTSMLQATATSFPAGSTCTTSLCGAGIANAAAAVAAAKGGGGQVAPGTFGKSAPASLASVSGSSVTLQWGAGSGATSYEYCYDTTNDSSCTNWISTGSATSATISGLAASTSFYWEVRATNATGTTYADGGAYWTFATLASPVPGAFAKSSPGNSVTNVRSPVTLRWAASPGAVSYEWCVSTTSGSCSTWTSTTSTSARTPSLPSRTVQYWQVRARNAGGTTDANAGTWWSFRTR